ncbi:hypothetical protein D9M68_264060 [compost metagenome]
MKPSHLSFLSAAALIALFPGFFLYNAAVAGGVIPAVLGGWFGPMTLLLGVPLILSFFLLHVFSGRLIFIDVMFLLYLLYIVSWASLHFALGARAQTSEAFYLYNLGTVIQWVVLYVAVRNVELRNKWFGAILLFSLVCFLAIAMSSAEGQFYDTATIAGGSATDVSGYQGLARSTAVTAMLLLAIYRGFPAVLVMIVTVPTLFLLGARSEFVGFLVVALCHFAVREGLSRTTLIWAPLGIGAIAYAAMGAHVLEGGSRILQLLEIQEATSYQARGELMRQALITISEHPVLGGYASQFSYGGMGDYSHNALSAWVTYGLIGFLGFVALLAYALVQALRLIRRAGSAHPQLALALAFSIYAATLAATSKSVNDPIFALAWGAIAAAMASHRHKLRRGWRPTRVVQPRRLTVV